MTSSTTHREHSHALRREIKLFQYLYERYGLNDDVALGKKIFMSPSRISMIRNGHSRLSARFILSIYDQTDLTIEQIRQYVNEVVYVKSA